MAGITEKDVATNGVEANTRALQREIRKANVDLTGGGHAAEEAMRRAYRRFYLRPGYLGTLLRLARTPRVFSSLVGMAAAVSQSLVAVPSLA